MVMSCIGETFRSWRCTGFLVGGKPVWKPAKHFLLLKPLRLNGHLLGTELCEELTTSVAGHKAFARGDNGLVEFDGGDNDFGSLH